MAKTPQAPQTLKGRLALLQGELEANKTVCDGGIEFFEGLGNLLSMHPQHARDIGGWLCENARSLAELIAVNTIAEPETQEYAGTS